MEKRLLTALILATCLLVTPTRTRAADASPNRFLSAPTYGITHFDSAQSDSFPFPVPTGTYHFELERFPQATRGPINIITLASTSPDYMWGVSSQGISYLDVSGQGLKEIARIQTNRTLSIDPGKLSLVLDRPFSNTDDLYKRLDEFWGVTDDNWRAIFQGSTYALVDKDNVLYVGSGSTVLAYGLADPNNPASGVRLLRSFDFAHSGALRYVVGGKTPAGRQTLMGLSLTYDGKLIALGHQGLAVLDRDMAGEPSVVRIGDDEAITNSMAVDAQGGIYVASDHSMYKLVWTGKTLSKDERDGAWSAPYDTGRQPPAVKLGTGTGSTPTLMGFGKDPDKLVVITDGADRMKLVAFWRDEIPAKFKQLPGTRSRRIAAQIPVTCGLDPKTEFIQTEQSVVVSGYGAFVVNNIRAQGADNRLVDVIGGGPLYPPPRGLQRFEWDSKKHVWVSVWSRPDVVATSMVPAMSSTSGIVLVNGYTPADGWEMTGLDWSTGKTVHRSIFGHDQRGNGAYAVIQFFPNGDALFNSIMGPIRIRYAK